MMEFQEVFFELRKAVFKDRFSRVPHQIQEKMEIMQGIQAHTEDFSRKIKMSEIGSAIILTGLTQTIWVKRLRIFSVAGLFD